MNKTCIVFICFLTAFRCVADPPSVPGEGGTFEQKVDLIVSGRHVKYPSWITSEITPDVILRLKSMKGHPTWIDSDHFVNDQKIDYALVMLGDRETILRMLDDFHHNVGHGDIALQFLGCSKLTYLEDDIYHGSTEPPEQHERKSFRDHNRTDRTNRNMAVLLLFKGLM